MPPFQTPKNLKITEHVDIHVLQWFIKDNRKLGKRACRLCFSGLPVITKTVEKASASAILKSWNSNISSL